MKQKVRETKWTKTVDLFLKEVLGEGNNSILSKASLLNRWKERNPKVNFPLDAFYAQYIKLSRRNDKKYQTVWTEKMVCDLLMCKEKAIQEQISMAKRNIKVSYMNIMHSHWLKLYPDSDLSAKNLQTRCYLVDKGKRCRKGKVKGRQAGATGGMSLNVSGRLVGRTESEGQCFNDNQQSQSYLDKKFANMPNDQALLYSMRMANERHACKPLFNSLCYNCGTMLFGNISEGHKFKVVPSFMGLNDEDANVQFLYENLNLPYKSENGGIWYSCRLCKGGTDVCTFSCADPKTGAMKIPDQLSNLCNSWEKGQVALCGLFSTTLRKANPLKRSWRHICGEVNVLHKLDKHYYGMYGFLVCKDKQIPVFDSRGRVIEAIRWLYMNNPLYTDFFSNYETLFRYDPTRPVVIAMSKDVTDAKSKSIEERLHNDDTGLVIPFFSENQLPTLKEGEDNAGIQHPGRNAGQIQKDLEKKTKVTYSDPDLEAKAWPHLFPFGCGSWKYGEGVGMTDYCKGRLLNYDNRWRSDPHWSFFWYDRMIKSRIFYYNKVRRARRNVESGPLTANQIRSEKESNNPYDVYGKDVPTTVPGSKGFWSSRLLDVLAMSRELGKPDFFITLTQNDGWPELQMYIKNGPDKVGSKMCHFEDELEMSNHHNPAMDYPTETVVAFQSRFKLFKEKVLEKNDGPLGNVKDYWYRFEYQHRGALHIHMVVWCEEKSVPVDAVTAEMPRSTDSQDNFTNACRSYVQKFQIHGCRPERCFKGGNNKVLEHCKYGFPFKLQESEDTDESGTRLLYVRRSEEDVNVVPYNLAMILLWQGHINVQRVTSGGWEMYLAKYVAKAEPSFDLKLLNDVSDAERYLRSRIVGRLEVDNTLLGFHLCQSSRTVVYLPTDIQPEFGILKRKCHLPCDENSTNVFYDSLFDKYLDRSEELKDILYPDYIRKYRFVSVNQGRSSVIGSLNDDADGDDDDDYDPKNMRKNVTHAAQKKHVDTKGRQLVERKPGKEGVPRWRFYKPNGDDQEKYYEQKLVLNVPFTRKDIEDDIVLSVNNKSKTFMEECMIRGLFDSEKDALDTLNQALHRGYSLERLQSLAQSFVDTNMISDKDSEMFMVDARMVRPDEPADIQAQVTDVTEITDAEKLGDLAVKQVEVDLDSMIQSLTSSQKAAFDHIDQNLAEQNQILLCIVGEAGTGKSYLIKSVVELMKKRHGSSVANLAPTGVAAHLINGTTVHSFFKMNIECESFLERGTPEFTLLRNVDNIIIDEFSMLEFKVFLGMDKVIRRVSPPSKRRLPFGGKNVILTGDPAQLPAIGKDIYDSFLFQRFAVMMLKEIVRQKCMLFANVLQKIRRGICDEEVESVLSSRVIPLEKQDDITLDKGTIIVSKRVERDIWNQKFLDCMPGEMYEFEAEDTDMESRPLSEVEKEKIKRFHRERLPDKLQLKIGARVVLLRNLDIKQGWVNGTLATIVSINKDFLIIKRLNSDKRIIVQKYKQSVASRFSTAAIVRYQFPLILGWALTVHKVQGMTLDKAYVLMNDSFFASGQAYVALSRVRSLENLHLLAFDKRVIFLSERQKQLLEWMTSVDSVPVNGNRPLPKLHEQTKLNIGCKEDVAFVETVAQTAISESNVPISTCKHREIDSTKNISSNLINSQRCRSLIECLIYDQGEHVTEVERILLDNAQLLQDAISHLRSIDPVTFQSSKNSVDHAAERSLHPVVVIHMTPVRTPSDGNCMWHAISQALVHTTEYMEFLRLVTVFTFIQNKHYFQNLIDEQHFATTTFEDIVVDALTLGSWGNEYHLHAMCLALNRPIHNFTSFIISDGYMPDEMNVINSLDELILAFERNERGTRQHILYMPNHTITNSRTPLRLFLSSSHYRALIPKVQGVPLPVPYKNLFERQSNYSLLNDFFNDYSQDAGLLEG